MAVRSTKKKTAAAANKGWDPTKEQTYKALASILQQGGVQVRREELKRGHGWKVVSGSCRLFETSVVFVDRKMSQEDQVSFLAAKVADLGLAADDERLAALPEVVRALCLARQRSQEQRLQEPGSEQQMPEQAGSEQPSEAHPSEQSAVS